MKTLQGVLAWTTRRKGQGFVLLTLVLVGASLFTFHAPKVHASGGPCNCFVHTSTAANTVGDFTIINDNPSSLPLLRQTILIVTHNWGSHGIYDPHPLGVWFTGIQWSIFNEDKAPMPVGLSFNVMLGSPQAQIVTATSHLTLDDATLIPSNVNSSNGTLSLLVTANWEPNKVYDPHPLGVYYTGAQWAIFNEDKGPMPLGASFNVDYYNSHSTQGTPTIAVPGSNAFGDFVLINETMDDTPNAIIEVTANWEPYAVYDPHPLGIWFTGSQWAIFNEDQTPIPANASFNVAVI